jgi:Protein of unknown function (DUF3386)
VATTVEESRADALLRSAQESAYKFPEGFAGFTANLQVDTDESQFGVVVRGPRDVQPDPAEPAPDGEAVQWALGELGGIVAHRWPQDYAEGDGRWRKRVVPEAATAAGELVAFEDDPFTSSYRVLDGQLTEVHRAPGESRFTIVIGARQKIGEKYVPSAFSVYHWSSEALTKVDMYVDEFVEVGGVWLPSLRRVTTGDANGLATRQLRLSDHTLQEP